MMQCPECQELLQRRLDGETLAPDPDLQEHVGHCGACRLLLAACAAFNNGKSSPPPPPGNLSVRLLDRVLQDRRTRRRAHVTWLVTMAVAASIAVMALAGYFSPAPRPTPVPDIAKSNLPPPADQAPPGLGRSMLEARQAVAVMSGRWTIKAKQQTKNLFSSTLEDMKLPALPETLPLQPAAESIQEAARSVADGFQPMTQTARRALAYFAKELPILEKTQ